MANLKIDGRMKVATLKEAFFNEFGGVLRIYDGNKRANDDALLCDIRVNDDVASGEYICRASRTVGKFCEEMMQEFGIKVKVATCDDWVLVLDGITLATIKKIPKQATIEMMKKFLAYQRKNNSSKEEEEDNVVVPAIYEDTNKSNEAGLDVVELDGKNGVVNIKGEVVIPIEYDYIRVHKNIIVATKEDKSGCFNFSGEVVIPIEYDDISIGWNYPINIIKAKKENKYGCFNYSGEIVIPIEYDYIRVHKNIIVATKEDKSGCFNFSGEVVIPIEYDDINVYDDLCVVSVGKEGKYGLFDLEGKELYPLQYDKIDSYTFDNALSINVGGRTIVIGKGGQITKTLEYDEIVKQGAEDKYLLVRKDGLWGKLDMKCNEILPCEYNYYILCIDYKADGLYKADAKETFGLEEVTEDSIRQFMEDNDLSDLQCLGYEYLDGPFYHITSVESISLISNDKGPKNWVTALRLCERVEGYDVEDFDVDEIEFEPAGYDISKGIVLVKTIATSQFNFELLLHEGEQFDPEQLRVCAMKKCHNAVFDAIYKGTPLSTLGTSDWDADNEYTCLYVDGECILEESNGSSTYDDEEWD